MRADDKWQCYWDLHVMAAVRLARGSGPVDAARGGGVILNNASICAAQPLWYEPIYNVTKAALVMLSKTLANELIPWGIRVNALNLGLVLTPDWIKTATELTAGQRQALAELHRRRRQGARADQALRDRPRRSPPSSCSSAPSGRATASAPLTMSTAAC